MSPRLTFSIFCIAAALIAWTGCDMFLVCDKGNCNAETPVIGRTFELRATMPLKANQIKFVGLYPNNSAVFSNRSSSTSQTWKLSQVEINLIDDAEERRLISHDCTNCPQITINSDMDNIYVSGGVFYELLNTGNKVATIDGAGHPNEITGLIFDSIVPRPFAHPNINCLVISEQPVSPYSNATAIILSEHSGWPTPLYGDKPTAFVAGDLDMTDQNNGLELILFAGGKIKLLEHQYKFWPDQMLQSSLQKAIDAIDEGNGVTIGAGFIANLDLDANVDFVFSNNKKIYSISYLNNYNFSPSSLLFELPGEMIKSIVAADLTFDGYPEIIIETDKNVYFYLNKSN